MTDARRDVKSHNPKVIREMTTIERAEHIMYCEYMTDAAINNWVRVMDVSHLEAARTVLKEAETMTDSGDEPMVDPDLVRAARKALKREQRKAAR